jgi:hypothetical protein
MVGRRVDIVPVRHVPGRGVEWGDGEAAPDVPTHVPPAVHRSVATPPLDVPALPMQCLRSSATAIGGAKQCD